MHMKIHHLQMFLKTQLFQPLLRIHQYWILCEMLALAASDDTAVIADPDTTALSGSGELICHSYSLIKLI